MIGADISLATSEEQIMLEGFDASQLPLGKGNGLRRDFHGFVQVRDCNDGSWTFLVSGFDETCTGQAGYCSVLRADGTEVTVPIDAEDRITINGKKYGRLHWIH